MEDGKREGDGKVPSSSPTSRNDDDDEEEERRRKTANVMTTERCHHSLGSNHTEARSMFHPRLTPVMTNMMRRMITGVKTSMQSNNLQCSSVAVATAKSAHSVGLKD